MTDKLYTQSDMEALRERCAKVADSVVDWFSREAVNPKFHARTRALAAQRGATAAKIADAIRNVPVSAAPKPIPADDREEVARKVIAFLAANKDQCGIEGDFDVLRATAVTLHDWGKK